jgi:exonuclease III
MRLISWNVNGRVDDALRRQTAAVLERDPEVIALQELTLESHAQWCDATAKRLLDREHHRSGAGPLSSG